MVTSGEWDDIFLGGFLLAFGLSVGLSFEPLPQFFRWGLRRGFSYYDAVLAMDLFRGGSFWEIG